MSRRSHCCPNGCRQNHCCHTALHSCCSPHQSGVRQHRCSSGSHTDLCLQLHCLGLCKYNNKKRTHKHIIIYSQFVVLDARVNSKEIVLHVNALYVSALAQMNISHGGWMKYHQCCYSILLYLPFFFIAILQFCAWRGSPTPLNTKCNKLYLESFFAYCCPSMLFVKYYNVCAATRSFMCLCVCVLCNCGMGTRKSKRTRRRV